jgi:hypothetical protein
MVEEDGRVAPPVGGARRWGYTMGLLLRLPARTLMSPAGGAPEATGRSLLTHCDYSRPGVDPWWVEKPTDPPEHGARPATRQSCDDTPRKWRRK